MADIKPKELRCVTSGRIFAYSPALAKRKDMVPVWKGANPNSPYEGPVGLAIDPGKAQNEQLVKALRERDMIIQEAGVQMQKLENEIDDLKEQLQTANAQINGLMEKLSSKSNPDLGAVEIPDADRQDIITEAVREMVKENNPDDFTKTHGLPRIEVIEARCGIAEISAAERDTALEALKKG